jgi:hypothetical protein
VPDAVEIVIDAWQHPLYGWVMISIEISTGVVLEMAFNPGVPASSISVRTQRYLIQKEVLPPIEQRGYVLLGAMVQRQRLPPLNVRVSRINRPGADGILGLDFIEQFTDIHFNVPTFRLTLSIQ